jgi:hypothetical protein
MTVEKTGGRILRLRSHHDNYTQNVSDADGNGEMFLVLVACWASVVRYIDGPWLGLTSRFKFQQKDYGLNRGQK